MTISICLKKSKRACAPRITKQHVHKNCIPSVVGRKSSRKYCYTVQGARRSHRQWYSVWRHHRVRRSAWLRKDSNLVSRVEAVRRPNGHTPSNRFDKQEKILNSMSGHLLQPSIVRECSNTETNVRSGGCRRLH